MIPTVSICIPTFEMGGRGTTMLAHLFGTIQAQQSTFTDFEVVISDHSLGDTIKDLCEEWRKHFTINYVRNTENRGSCEANLNNAIAHAKGKFIKPLLQDDFLLTDVALLHMTDHLVRDTDWIATGCLHCREDNVTDLFHPHPPQWVSGRALALGQNHIGSPSVVMYPREHRVEFDAKLLWLMDCEFYSRLFQDIGHPKLLRDNLVCIRFRHDSISDSQVSAEIAEEEKKYIQHKFDQMGIFPEPGRSAGAEFDIETTCPIMYKRLKDVGLL
jgi:glycosyltransferase involved in cell wall biosynthesis